MEELIRELLKNPVFGGLGAASVFGYLLYVLRKVPSLLWTAVRWRIGCSVVFFSEDACYEQVNEWLGSLDYAKRCRRLKLTSRYDYDEQRDLNVLAPGLGVHMFMYQGRLMVLSRKLPDKGGLGGWKRFEDVHLAAYGFAASDLIREVVDSIEKTRANANRSTVDVYLYRHRWRIACRKPKRALGTVVLPAGVMEDLVADVQRFIDDREWYQARGVPYRRGYAFTGPPGNGKTSAVLALASHFNRPIYALNLGSLSNDDELIDAVCEVPENGILLIEDIDAAKASAKRKDEPAQSPGAPKGKDEEKKEISLSALLNAIDGVFSREGRILAMTTNHPEKVDPALLRRGRADYRVEFGNLGPPEIARMCVNFYGEDDGLDARFGFVCTEDGLSAAEVQEQLLAMRE